MAGKHLEVIKAPVVLCEENGLPVLLRGNLPRVELLGRGGHKRHQPIRLFRKTDNSLFLILHHGEGCAVEASLKVPSYEIGSGHV